MHNQKRVNLSSMQRINLVQLRIFVQFVIFFYSRSVRLFSTANYKDFKIDFMTKATNDGKLYICMTCQESITTKRTPFQAVSYKLDVEVVPKLLQNLRNLRRYSYHRKCCSKKLHGKGEFAKIKGNICHIPVETDTVMCCQDL